MAAEGVNGIAWCIAKVKGSTKEGEEVKFRPWLRQGGGRFRMSPEWLVTGARDWVENIVPAVVTVPGAEGRPIVTGANQPARLGARQVLLSWLKNMLGNGERQMC